MKRWIASGQAESGAPRCFRSIRAGNSLEAAGQAPGILGVEIGVAVGIGIPDDRPTDLAIGADSGSIAIPSATPIPIPTACLWGCASSC